MTAAEQHEKALRFQALHQRPGAFVIPNPWDAGSARLLAGLGFEAVATSSGACADVLFAPGLPDLDAVRTVCASLAKPVNFMVGIPGRSFSVSELQAAGVKRISLATSLYRAAMAGLYNAAVEVKEQGTFGYVQQGLPTGKLNELMRGTGG